MSKQKSNLAVRIIIFILAIILIVGFLSAQSFKNASNNPIYTVQEGKCTYDLEKEKQELYGEWEFYYKQLLVTDNIDTSLSTKKIEYLSVPSKWNIETNGEYPVGGYASYRTYISGIPVGRLISIGFDNLSCAYTIYVNGKPIGQSGAFEKVEYQNSTSYKAISIPGDQIEYTYYEILDENPIEVVIEVATDNNGGLYKCPILFSNERISRFICNKIVQKCIVVGMLFIGVLMHIFKLLTTKKGNRNIIPLLLISILFVYSIFSGTLYAFLSLSNIFKAAAYIDTVTVILDILLSIFVCINFYDKNHKVKSSIGYIMIFMSYLFMIVAYVYEYSGLYVNSLYKMIILGIKPVLMIIPMLFLFKPNDNSDTMIFNRLSLICLAITAFIKSINSSGAFYDSTRNYESIYTLLAVFFSVISYFLGVDKTNKLLWDNEKLTEDNTQFKINLLLNQIKPHFLYNTLNSINSLCKINPNEASNAIVSFSNYLRNNMESISDSNMIPVSKELEHVKCYIDIEQIRFRERLTVKYEVKAYDFLVPPLAIQAIAENAIKHGMSSMVEGVTITIKTYEDKDYNYIVVADNGVGFDINSIVETDSVGLRNIFRRIEMLCKGELILKSRIGKGTSITLKLKK